MTIDKQVILTLSKSAELSFTDDEAAELAREIEKALVYFDSTDLPEETIGYSEESLSGNDHNMTAGIREDESIDYDHRQELFKNTKKSKDNFLVIPKILD